MLRSSKRRRRLDHLATRRRCLGGGVIDGGAGLLPLDLARGGSRVQDIKGGGVGRSARPVVERRSGSIGEAYVTRVRSVHLAA